MKVSSPLISLFLAVGLIQVELATAFSGSGNATVRDSKGNHHDHKQNNSNMHNHLSRRVFDRACAASRDTIDEILSCLVNNEHLTKSINPDTAKNCYKESFNIDFDPKDLVKHKDLICNNREKFELMTTCVYRKTAEVLDSKELEKLTEAMVDVGLCIINALDS